MAGWAEWDGGREKGEKENWIERVYGGRKGRERERERERGKANGGSGEVDRKRWGSGRREIDGEEGEKMGEEESISAVMSGRRVSLNVINENPYSKPAIGFPYIIKYRHI